MSTTRTRPEPAHAVITALVERQLLDRADANLAESVVERVLAAPALPPAEQPGEPGEQGEPQDRRGGLVEIAGYAGGALVLAALGLFLAERWGGFSRAEQLVAVGAVTVLLLGAGVVAALTAGGLGELRHPAEATRRRLASTLLSAGSLAAGFTAGMAVDLWGRVGQDGEWPAFTFGLTATVVALAAYRVAPSALGQLVLAAGTVVAVTAGLWVAAEPGATGYAVVLLVVAGAWLAAAAAGLLHEQTLAHVLAAALALFGAQLPIGEHSAVAYLLTAVVATLGFVGYLRGRSWPFLAAGVLGVTLVVPEAVVDWTDGSLGVAGAVLITGLTMLAASLAGFRASRSG